MNKRMPILMMILAGLVAVGAWPESLAQAQPEGAVVYDDFDDNAPGGLWRTYVEDPNNCQLIETDNRLELRTLEPVNGAFAGYIANAWRLDPAEDFSLRIDFHYDLQVYPQGRLNIGLTPSEDDPRGQRLDFGVGCANLYSNYWYEFRNGLSARTSYISRAATDGTLYMSYNSVTDTLYLGDASYGEEYAWMTIDGILRGQWEGKPVYLYIGGSANGLEITPGHAYLDNLVVEEGTAIESALHDVYRFWSPITGTHFYTASDEERDKLLENSADVWTYEGVVFRAFPDASDPQTKPVYRFWSGSLGTHFYTLSESEKNKLIEEYADVWVFEGAVFYAYTPDEYPAWASPVYRFWSPVTQAHFFTLDEAERDWLISEYSDVWTYEGIAWYANK